VVWGPYSAAVLSEQRNILVYFAVGVGFAAERVVRARNGRRENFMIDCLEELASREDRIAGESTFFKY